MYHRPCICRIIECGGLYQHASMRFKIMHSSTRIQHVFCARFYMFPLTWRKYIIPHRLFIYRILEIIYHSTQTDHMCSACLYVFPLTESRYITPHVTDLTYHSSHHFTRLVSPQTSVVRDKWKGSQGRFGCGVWWSGVSRFASSRACLPAQSRGLALTVILGINFYHVVSSPFFSTVCIYGNCA